MVLSIKKAIRTQDLPALGEIVRGLGFELSEQQLQGICRAGAKVGGSLESPWSEGTWRMWLKRQAAEPVVEEKSLERSLLESSSRVWKLPGFEIRDFSGWYALTEEFSDEAWDELFPFAEGLSQPLEEEFAARGGCEFLGKAPFASWLFARLTFLGVTYVEEDNELGGYQTQFVAVNEDDGAEGLILLEADSGQVGFWLQARTEESYSSLRQQILEFLTEDIKAVKQCELEVYGAEIDFTNTYGWNGEHFLGEGNVGE